MGRKTASPLFASNALLRAHAALDAETASAWRWWVLRDPPRANLRLWDLIESAPADVGWRSEDQTKAMIAIMSERSRKKLAEVRAEGGPRFGALYRRTRPDGAGGRRMRAEVRFDGFAGCLRTPGGGRTGRPRQGVRAAADPRGMRTRRARTAMPRAPAGTRVGSAGWGSFGSSYAGELSGYTRLGEQPLKLILPSAPFRR